MTELILIRQEDDRKQTLGTLKVYDGTKELFSCCTLEPAWMWNQKNISCIPTGTYSIRERFSDKYKDHLRIINPDGSEIFERSMILIHAGNFRENTEGCILVGNSFIDIDRDGLKDITSSKDTLKSLLAIVENGMLLKIITAPNIKYF